MHASPSVALRVSQIGATSPPVHPRAPRHGIAR
jgi:hypothetical protein